MLATSIRHTTPSTTDVKFATESALAIADGIANRLAATATERDAQGGTPKRERDLLRESGLLALTIPVEHGGPGLGWDTLLEVVRRIARADPSIAHVFAFHHLMLATVRLLGSEAQSAKAYRETLSGRLFWGNALNPRDTRTRLVRRGKQLAIDGTKSFCSGARDSDRLVVSALEPETNRLKVAVVPSRREGIRILDDWNAFGQRQTDSGTVEFHYVKLEEAELLETPGPLGSIYASLRSCLEQAVLVHLYLGIAEGAFEAARARGALPPYAREVERRRPRDPYNLLRWGEMLVALEGARALAERARTSIQASWARGGALTHQERGATALAVATARVAATTAGLDICERIFQVLGARATSREEGLDRFWRNLRVHTLHDPIDHKLKELGLWAAEGELPEPGSYS